MHYRDIGSFTIGRKYISIVICGDFSFSHVKTWWGGDLIKIGPFRIFIDKALKVK